MNDIKAILKTPVDKLGSLLSNSDELLAVNKFDQEMKNDLYRASLLLFIEQKEGCSINKLLEYDSKGLSQLKLKKFLLKS